MSATQKLSFPTVLKVHLHSFSLYKLKPNLDLEFPAGVFCLAGANGLGKTTFLATLNYGLTGIVPNLSANFLASSDYYQDNYRDRAFSKKFFDGRITDKDRTNAAISIVLQAGNLQFEIKRYLFDYEGLAYLHVVNIDSGELEYKGGEESLEQNELAYQRLMCDAIGLIGFEQYVFLQHFVLTFDESRRLLLWDSEALNEALYLCIGADYNNARKASELTRAMDKFGSRARNTQFQASNVRARIETIQREFAKTATTSNDEAETTPEEVEASHRALVKEADKLHRRVVEKQREVRDCDLQWIERSSKLTALQSEFEREFTRRVETRSQIHFHPTISATISENRCAICHSPGVADSVQSEIDNTQCPLCNSPLPPQTPDEDARLNISRLDIAVGQARDKLREVLQAKERLSKELEASEDSEQGALAQLQAFEVSNTRMLKEINKNQTQSHSNDIASTISRLEVEFAELTKKKEEQYAERDEKRKQLLVLQKGLKRAYAAAEEDFVPLLQELASAFLGIDLQVAMEARTSISDFGLALVLSVRGTPRREDTQLSESQRFFLDIALRMALVQYISASDSKAELLIDTPEGSLDIAYEARAGSMFAQFVRSGHNMFMTANINSSQLLLELARECGSSLMTLSRMTTWTELSDVQAGAESLFNKAFSAIEAQM